MALCVLVQQSWDCLGGSQHTRCVQLSLCVCVQKVLQKHQGMTASLNSWHDRLFPGGYSCTNRQTEKRHSTVRRLNKGNQDRQAGTLVTQNHCVWGHHAWHDQHHMIICQLTTTSRGRSRKYRNSGAVRNQCFHSTCHSALKLRKQTVLYPGGNWESLWKTRSYCIFHCITLAFHETQSLVNSERERGSVHGLRFGLRQSSKEFPFQIFEIHSVLDLAVCGSERRANQALISTNIPSVLFRLLAWAFSEDRAGLWRVMAGNRDNVVVEWFVVKYCGFHWDWTENGRWHFSIKHHLIIVCSSSVRHSQKLCERVISVQI